MEYKIGQVFEFKGKWYQFVEVNSSGCNNCVFNQGLKCIYPDSMQCARFFRTDRKSGHVVLLDAIGDVYEQGGAIWQQYKCVDKPNTEDKRVYISHSDSDIGLIISVRLTENDDLNLIERNIGEIFEHNREWYQCVEEIGCDGCAFNTIKCDEIDDIIGNCTMSLRHDDKSVVFKKLQKVGEPYEHCGKLYQCYKLPMEIEIRLLPNNCNPIGKDNLVEIEIKQNKEDMETTISNDAIEHSNIENIGKNLKPFDLQAAKSGKPVCTRDGRKARIICFDVKGDICPIIALVEENGMEVTKSYDENGRANYKNADNYDLMMLPEKKEGWVNVYHSLNGISERVCGDIVSKTKEEAIQYAQNEDSYITTVKIEWEE